MRMTKIQMKPQFSHPYWCMNSNKYLPNDKQSRALFKRFIEFSKRPNRKKMLSIDSHTEFRLPSVCTLLRTRTRADGNWNYLDEKYGTKNLKSSVKRIKLLTVPIQFHSIFPISSGAHWPLSIKNRLWHICSMFFLFQLNLNERMK